MEDKRLLGSFEKASQEYFKESWEFGWTLIGVVVLLALVVFGIYFSQVAIAEVIGAQGVMLYFGWAAAISVSALEVAGIKLLGDRSRSQAIKTSNALEHKVAFWFTVLLFIFDILTNFYGLYLVAAKVTPQQAIPFLGYIVIVFFGALMAISEILVGWMFRAIATSYVSYKQAKQKYDAYKEKVDSAVMTNIDLDTGFKPSTSVYPKSTAPVFPASRKADKIQSSFWNDQDDLGKDFSKFQEEYYN
jgi:hypothetical protein